MYQNIVSPYETSSVAKENKICLPVANEKKRASLVPVVGPVDKSEEFLVDPTASSGDHDKNGFKKIVSTINTKICLNSTFSSI